MIRDTFFPTLFSVISSKCSLYKKLQNLTKSYLSRPKVVKFTTMTVLHLDCQYLLILKSNPTKPSGFNHSVVILPNCGKKVSQKMLVVRVTENVRAVQSSYYSSCPCLGSPNESLHYLNSNCWKCITMLHKWQSSNLQFSRNPICNF
jgi:hypothetical protein